MSRTLAVLSGVAVRACARVRVNMVGADAAVLARLWCALVDVNCNMPRHG